MLDNKNEEKSSNREAQTVSRRSFLKGSSLSALAIGGLGFMRPELSAADNSNVITVTATLKLNPDKADEAITAIKELVAGVEKSEPGVLAYICNRGLQDRNEIMFFEIYADQTATEAHGKTAHMAKFGGKVAELTVGKMKIVPYQQVTGYHR